MAKRRNRMIRYLAGRYRVGKIASFLLVFVLVFGVFGYILESLIHWLLGA